MSHQHDCSKCGAPFDCDAGAVEDADGYHCRAVTSAGGGDLCDKCYAWIYETPRADPDVQP